MSSALNLATLESCQFAFNAANPILDLSALTNEITWFSIALIASMLGTFKMFPGIILFGLEICGFKAITSGTPI